MRRRSRAVLFAAAGIGFASATAASAAPSPVGEWMVANGQAIIRIVDCGGQYWGLVAWEKNPGGTDVNNPNPALRNRPTLGMPILLGMTSSAAQPTWSGQIYNSQDGRTYAGRVSLAGPATLHVEGCVLGFLCGGEDWRRVNGGAAMAASGRSGGRTAAVAKEPA